MKHTLLMRIAGPMQAWGLQSRFAIRDTAREPTKSGILGLVCAALGKPREEQPDDGSPLLRELAALVMGVKVEREGHLRRDFHTAMDVMVADSTLSQIEKGRPKLKATEPSERFYLADAWFIVGLSGMNRSLLERIDQALDTPYWPLFFGRKAFPPGWPVRMLDRAGAPIGLVDKPLCEALSEVVDPFLSPSPASNATRVVMDAGFDDDRVSVVARRIQPDHPLSFHTRRYIPRDIVIGYIKQLHDHES